MACRVLFMLVGATMLGTTLSGEARACPVPAGASEALADRDASSRLAFIRATLDDQATRSSTWSWGWGITGTVLVAGNFTLAALATNTEDRTDSIVGGSTSVLIPLLILVLPPRVLADQADLEATVAQGGDVCKTLAHAEELLARDADDQAFGTGVLAHAVAIGFNVTLGLVLGLGFGHWKGAATVGGGGIVISEAQLLTKPRGAIHALERYRQGDLSSPGASRGWFVTPLVAPAGLGAQLVFAF